MSSPSSEPAAVHPSLSCDPSELIVELRSEGSSSVLTLTGRLCGAMDPADRDKILEAIRPGVELVVDFSGVTEVNGGGLRRLLLMARHVRALGGQIATKGVSDHLQTLAEASGFNDLLASSAPLPVPAPEHLMRMRTDYYPTHHFGGFSLRAGTPMPLGATALPHGVNFAVYSRHATSCTLVLFEPDKEQPFIEIPFLPEFRTGDVYAMTVFNLDPEEFEYGYRVDGPMAPAQGHRFDRQRILVDPAARGLAWRPTWGRKNNNLRTPRGRLIADDFDWGHDRPVGLPLQDLVIYEMHVRGYTRHESAQVRFPGTYAGLRERIPHLVELGVNCVELLPIFEFDETEVERVNPDTGEKLVNYWGYNTLGFYAPKAGYAATGPFHLQSDEFKTLVKDLHAHGIEVILDVVFNHTMEGNENGPTLSFRGLDNSTYYMLTPQGYYFNFSGCGNTLNCNHPVVRDYVLNCLRYWVAEYHIDGFRFDLASILGRAADGTPLTNPPLLESLALDAVLGRTKLIAEAWDAGGLYQVGHFPAYGRWAEWNGKYRDCVRKFLKGDMGQVSEMALRVSGSPDLYFQRGPSASVNFITCHDGFTLADLFSYNEKHNQANGEHNRDGANDNHSWNCGAEGPTNDPAILELRRRQLKNAVAILFASQGVPMFLMGDEIGRSQNGNNNTYCQDNELNWVNWNLKEANAELFRFCRTMIEFRKAHPCLRHHQFAGSSPGQANSLEITWHGTQAWHADWSGASRVLAFQVRLRGTAPDDLVYVAMNMYWETLSFEPPRIDDGRNWHMFANTSLAPPHDIVSPGQEIPLGDLAQIAVGGRSVVILVAR